MGSINRENDRENYTDKQKQIQGQRQRQRYKEKRGASKCKRNKSIHNCIYKELYSLTGGQICAVCSSTSNRINRPSIPMKTTDDKNKRDKDDDMQGGKIKKEGGKHKLNR